MTWQEIKMAYNSLANAARAEYENNALFEESVFAWKVFCEIATRGPTEIPYHMGVHFECLAELGRHRDRRAIRILDHGCGGGLTILYLLANGYEGIHGIDIGGQPEVWNTFLVRHARLSGPRFHVYDGSVLPFEDATFDLIFSEQVLEHVRPNAIAKYYSEEYRVLHPGGLVFHRVPHRLSPYEGHTRTWLLHYLPRNIWLHLLRALGKSSATAEEALYLRWPWVHRRLARTHLGSCEDRTLKRIQGMSDLTGFEGPKGLRRALGFLVRVPLLNQLVWAVLRNFVMLDTVSRKPKR